MEATFCQTSRFSSSIPRQFPLPLRRAPAALVKVRSVPAKNPAVKCAKPASVPEKREIETVERERQVAAEMEWLEREAIMGEDQGREANDYNRRAQIFDESARVFQALKERETATASSGAES